MKIGMIGAGKVGFSLGKFLSLGKHQITGYMSRNPDSAKEAAAFTNSKPYESLQALIHDSDAIFITVPDNAISEIYQKIRTFELQDKYICHCSGALSAAQAFPDLAQTGAYGISIHPLFPISSKYDAYRELPGAFFCLEGDAQAVEVFAPLLGKCGVQVQRMDAAHKTQYHLACTMASNLVCALAQQSMELLEGCGFSAERARQALAPLMRSNLQHILESGAIEALTGPVERGDADTVRKHLQCLTGAEEREIYRILSRKLVKMAQKKHPQQQYQQLDILLQEEGKA